MGTGRVVSSRGTRLSRLVRLCPETRRREGRLLHGCVYKKEELRQSYVFEHPRCFLSCAGRTFFSRVNLRKVMMSTQPSRRIFLSYDYVRDVHRAATVGASWIAQGGVVRLENTKVNNNSEIVQWIDRGIDRASVTVVLVGSHTRQSKWVEYEIRRSELTGKGLLGVDVSGIRDQFGCKSACEGVLPVGYPFYNWIADDGERNLAQWVDQAIRARSRLANAGSPIR